VKYRPRKSTTQEKSGFDPAGNGVDLTNEPFTLGPQLTYDPKKDRFVGSGADKANRYVTCSYREPSVMPKNV
jgi:hypothetical protein